MPQAQPDKARPFPACLGCFQVIASLKLLALAGSGARYQTVGAMSFPDNCRSRHLSREPRLDAIASPKLLAVAVIGASWYWTWEAIGQIAGTAESLSPNSMQNGEGANVGFVAYFSLIFRRANFL